jgi:EmrB/QacA subfamily drug resistance transporter
VRRPSRQGLTLAATIIGSSLAFIDATVVFVAAPTIESDLGFGLSGEQWLFLAYSLPLAALYLPAGAIGDRYGRREVFIAGAVGFALASALAGLAPNTEVLLLTRGVQGVAAAFLTTNSLALLRASYGDEAGRAVGLWTAFTSVSTIVGPPRGGALAEWASWRWIFLINLPLAVAVVVLARLGICKERAALRVGRLDVPGAAAAAVGFGALTYALVEGAERGLDDVWWAVVVAVVGLAAFVVVELKVAEPMLPFALFRHRNFAAANVETFFAYAALYAVFYFLTLYVQFLGFSPFEAGLINIPTTLVMILLAARFGALADRHGPRLFLTLGPALLGLGALLFVALDERDDFWTWGVAGLFVFSLGLAVMVAPITATALKSAPSAVAGVASGVNNTVSRLGSLLAIAVIGAVVSLVFKGQVDVEDAVPLARDQQNDELRDASVEAFRAAMVIAAALAFTAAVIGAAGISNRELRKPEVTEPEAAPAPAGT